MTPGGRRTPGAVARTVLVLLVALAAVGATLAAPSPAVASPAAPAAAPAAAAPSYEDRPDFYDPPRRCADPYGFLKAQPCRITPHVKGAPLLVLWGDSHAWQVLPAIRAALGSRRVNVVALVMGGCPPVWTERGSAAGARNGCDDFGRLAVDWLRRAAKAPRPMRVVVGIAWELYHNVTDPRNDADTRYPGLVNSWIAANAVKSLPGTPRAFRQVARLGVPVDVVGQSPMVYFDEPPCARGELRCDLPRNGTLKDPGENAATIKRLRSLLPRGGLLVRPAQSLCDARVCFGTYRGVPTYYDRFHIGERASQRLAPYFRPTVAALVRAARRR